MKKLIDHFKTDFSETKTEDLKEVPIQIIQSGRDTTVFLQFHHDEKNHTSFMSIKRPSDWNVEEVTSFYQNNLPELLKQCSSRSKVTNFPKYTLSKTAYVYADVAGLEQNTTVDDFTVVRRGQTYCQLMANLEHLINNYLSLYESNEEQLYQQIAESVSANVKKALADKKILAIVTHRTKEPKRLKAKLWQRALPLENAEATYLQDDDIRNDIIDLAGVRVALYFPGDRQQAVDAILQKFSQQHKLPKHFPEEQRKHHRERRFSGYKATHLRPRIPGTEFQQPGRNFAVEIQIASVIMHAWSEVEHDLDYKQLDGIISDLELQMLDQLNGLALAGEISLEQLQIARDKRIFESKQMKGL